MTAGPEGNTRFHLAQVNIAQPLEPLDSPRLVDFMATLDEVNVVHVGSRYKAGGVMSGLVRMTKIQLTALRGFVKFATKFN